MTTPLPMTGVTPGVRIPDGSRCRAYFSSPDDDRVAGVVAAVELHDEVDLLAEQVGRFALALIAPLGAEQRNRRHRSRPFTRWARHMRRAPVASDRSLLRDEATLRRRSGGNVGRVAVVQELGAPLRLVVLGDRVRGPAKGVHRAQEPAVGLV